MPIDLLQVVSFKNKYPVVGKLKEEERLKVFGFRVQGLGLRV